MVTMTLSCPFQAPLTATTPLVVPSSTSRPDSDGEAKGASALPRLILYRTCPLAGLSSYSTPEFPSGTHTAPPPRTGEPRAGPGPGPRDRVVGGVHGRHPAGDAGHVGARARRRHPAEGGAHRRLRQLAADAGQATGVQQITVSVLAVGQEPSRAQQRRGGGAEVLVAGVVGGPGAGREDAGPAQERGERGDRVAAVERRRPRGAGARADVRCAVV